MFRRPLLLTVLVAAQAANPFGCQRPEPSDRTLPARQVIGNLLDSEAVPDIAIQVDEAFRFVGSFDFEIEANSDEWPDDLVGKPIAAGERFVFVDSNASGLVERLFVVQFEGFLGNNEETYNYNFSTAKQLGENRYRQNNWFYNSREQAELNPNGEGARTRAFLAEKGFQVADDFMMSRYVGLASEDRRNEIILYYIEMMNSSLGYTLQEWEDESVNLDRSGIEEQFVTRSQTSFEIVRG